jgi:hypothetical protein
VRQIDQHLQRLADNLMRLAAFDVDDKANTAGVMFVLRIVQTRGRWWPRDTRIRCAHFFVHNIFQEEPASAEQPAELSLLLRRSQK